MCGKNTIHRKNFSHFLLVGHAGHGAAKQNGNRLFTLDEQIQHKVDFIQQYLLAKNKNTQLILVGHSIGAFICMKLFHKPDLKVIQVRVLF
jgi:alpha-beta hydrolase superfamily lysophospholipase